MRVSVRSGRTWLPAAAAEARTSIQVTPNKELYPLDVGVPKPARVRVVNADPETPVYLIEDETGHEMPLGTVREVSRIDILMRRPTEQRRFDIGGRLWRIQCKCGRVSSGGDVLVVHTTSSRRTATGFARR